MVPSILSQEIPESLVDWESQKRVVSDEERKILAADTEFARRYYSNVKMSNFPGVEASVVFSGKDINNSLHRPEVCLRAQGWNFVSERSILVPNLLSGGEGVPFREIVCVRPRVSKDNKRVPMNKWGNPLYDKQILYYTFFGSEKVVSGHYERTFEDIKGRLLGGYDQQWAYATFSVGVTSVYREQGFNIKDEAVFDEDESRKVMEEFLGLFLPEVVREK